MADTGGATQKKRDPYAVIRLRPFRNYLAGRMCSTISFQILGLLVSWQIFDITHDPARMAYIGLIEAVPNIVTALYAGSLADSFNRKKIIIIGLLCMAGVISLLAFISRSEGFMAGAYALPVIFAAVFIMGVARGFLQPALFGIQAQLVAREQLANASTFSSSTWQASAIIGPALGGLMYVRLGAWLSYAVAGIILLAGIFFMWRMRPGPQQYLPKGSERLREKIFGGVRFVFGNSILLGAFTLDMFAVFFGGEVAMLPFFVTDVLKVGPEWLGILRAAPAIGAVVMAGILVYFPIKGNVGKPLFITVAVFGLAMIGFGLSRFAWLSFACLAISGMADNLSVVIRSTIMQLETPDGMRGRVSAVSSIFVGSSNEIGAFESGMAAHLLGSVVRSVVFGGTMTLVVVGATARAFPRLRRVTVEQMVRKSAIRNVSKNK